MKLLTVLSLSIVAGCAGASPEDVIGEQAQALQTWYQDRMVYENWVGTTSSFVPVNCPNNPDDPGHWNCVSGVINASDTPSAVANNGVTNSFTPELCINKSTGGFEFFELAESAPLHNPATVLRVIPEWTVWVWGLTPG